MTAPLIPSFRPDGSVMDLADIQLADIDWRQIAAALARIPRFNGRLRPEAIAFSVAQHCIMGAQAIYHDTEDHELAAYFLLHDAHEAFIGDIPTPTVELIAHWLGGGKKFRRALAQAKAAIDERIFAAAGLRPLRRMPLSLRKVEEMDRRMLRAEAVALFGPRAGDHVGGADLPPPRLAGTIRGKGAMEVEQEFIECLERFRPLNTRMAA